MPAVTGAMVKELREKTGAGMLDCKNALTEADGDMEKAVEVLRKKGVASAAKKSGRLASEGLVHVHLKDGVASIVEVNSETDFVAKNEEFQNFVKEVAKHVHQHKPKDLDALLKQEFGGTGKDLATVTQEKVAKIGENLSVRRFALMSAGEQEQLGAYTHMGSKIVSVVKVQGDPQKITEETLKGIAMHVAAAAPRYLTREEIPQEVKDKEKEIFRAQMKDSGKPPEILEKILEGKLNKFANEVCLVEQIYIRDPDGKNSVEKFLKSMDPNAKVTGFIRFQVGEGMAKKEENFAEEVAKQIKK